MAKRVFPNDLKLVEVTPVFKKDDPFNKKSYRPVSIFPTISKIQEKLMQRQINNYISNHLSPYLCGYRKGYNTEQAFVCLIKNGKRFRQYWFLGCRIDGLVESFKSDKTTNSLLLNFTRMVLIKNRLNW